jgi:hypothetical protein
MFWSPNDELVDNGECEGDRVGMLLCDETEEWMPGDIHETESHATPGTLGTVSRY